MIFPRRTAAKATGQPISSAPGGFGSTNGRPAGFEYLDAKEVYLDSACQTLRPQPVINSMVDYFQRYNACGERAKYAWGVKVDEQVAAVRVKVLDALGLSAKQYAAAFTLNTTYGINLLLNQLPRFAKVVTSHTEHNSVFLSTIAYANRVGAQRILLEKDQNGALIYSDAQLTGAVTVVSAMDNVRGLGVPNLRQLVADAHRVGGVVIIDAAQAFSHSPAALHGLGADAICFSAHKAYGASLGVIVARNEFINSLILTFVGGGMVSGVKSDSYTLLPEPYARLEPGLQAWGEIIALGSALDYLKQYPQLAGEVLETRESRLGAALYDAVAATGKFTMFSGRGASLVTAIPKSGDAHRFAVFLSKANVMVRSGHFCAHHWLEEQLRLPPLVRFSVGAHNNDSDITQASEMVGRLAKTL